ncbi:HAMP domain-containing sensor histidine kinase [Desulfobotulus sp.]|jgi:signal transduction histidine kinase|uniref:sensor histidine kinase n=1 Tax=Desulfobotulus sp. TaxID=1940337 RepID=UPI002A35D23D|nr:HAMP domain-containing sensor histidine kinase [Desulfobotulus sp.]MDY0163327.1 HAMP domain-containing sensor histidine kinase [Desulfobotulus sp.]
MDAFLFTKPVLQAEDSGEVASAQAMMDLLEARARLVDERIIGEFLRSLVVDYSRVERRLADLIQEKNRLMGMAAHDIRNPLASIRGFADLLLDGAMGDLSEGQRDFVSLISKTSHELLHLLNDLLDLSAVSEGLVQLKREKACFVRLAKTRIQLVQPLADQKHIRMEEISGEGKVFFPFDSGKISQVMDNLLGNAIKYSYPGGHIHVSMGLEAGFAFFEVQDAGPGIPPGEEDRLFAPFSTLSVKSTAGEKSTGLGLFISKRIVNAHGGEVFARNGSKGGAEFGFRIPTEMT